MFKIYLADSCPYFPEWSGQEMKTLCLPSYCAKLKRLREKSVAVAVICKLQIFLSYTFRSHAIYIFILYVHEWQNVGRIAGCLNRELSTASNDKDKTK